MKLLEDAVEEQGKVEFMEKLRMLTKLTIVVPLILSYIIITTHVHVDIVLFIMYIHIVQYNIQYI